MVCFPIFPILGIFRWAIAFWGISFEGWSSQPMVVVKWPTLMMDFRHFPLGETQVILERRYILKRFLSHRDLLIGPLECGMVFGGAPLDFFKKIPSTMGMHLLEGNDKSGAWISDYKD